MLYTIQYVRLSWSSSFWPTLPERGADAEEQLLVVVNGTAPLLRGLELFEGIVQFGVAKVPTAMAGGIHRFLFKSGHL